MSKTGRSFGFGCFTLTPLKSRTRYLIEQIFQRGPIGFFYRRYLYPPPLSLHVTRFCRHLGEYGTDPAFIGKFEGKGTNIWNFPLENSSKWKLTFKTLLSSLDDYFCSKTWQGWGRVPCTLRSPTTPTIRCHPSCAIPRCTYKRR